VEAGAEVKGVGAGEVGDYEGLFDLENFGELLG
jgi:hypothetical protein